MRVPDAVFDDGPNPASLLKEFADNLATNNIARWRRRVPTYADIVADGDNLLSRMFFFDAFDTQERLTTDGLLERVRA